MPIKSAAIYILFICNIIHAQNTHEGWILNTEGDTMKCKIFSFNGLHKNLKKRNESYFYDYAFISTNDNRERRITPDEIKEYYFEYGDSTNKTEFHAVTQKISHNKGFIVKRKDAGFYNVFVRKLVANGYYHLFYYEQLDWIDGSVDKNFILYNSTDSSSTSFITTRRLMDILDWPAESNRKNKRYKDWFIGKQNLVFDYNMYRAAIKNGN